MPIKICFLSFRCQRQKYIALALCRDLIKGCYLLQVSSTLIIFMLYNQIYNYTNFSAKMERFIGGHRKTQIKQIINMQNLLNQYDRQNKFLNRQVLQLLEENKVLKIDKIRHNIITQFTEMTPYKKKENVKSQTKQEDLQVLKRWKQQNDAKTSSQKPKTKKDQAVQVNDLMPSISNIQVDNTSIKKQPTEGLVFSFGTPTVRTKVQEKNELTQSRRQSPTKRVKNIATSPEKIPSTHHKELVTIEMLKSPILQIQEKEKQKIQFSREQIRSHNLVRQNNLSQQSSGTVSYKKRLRSSHAIQPSPRIESFLDTKSFFRQRGDQFIKRGSSIQCYKGQSMEKKRRFLNVISSKQKISYQRRFQSNCDCC